MKRVLIISPYFPPVNAADMQRVRMSLPYFEKFGWDAEVVMVDEKYADINTDELLLASVPPNIKIHKVKAFNKQLTAKIGLGSIALRSLWFYKHKVNKLLKTGSYDLIYFSTTQFPVCVLGAYWKKKFNIPYVIDMQDPWHSDYYLNKPKHEQPPKYWFSYRLNKYLEPIALKQVGGLISVSAGYINDLKNRYPVIKNIPAKTITFGAFKPDVEIAANNENHFKNLLEPNFINVVYVGRGGADMYRSITIVFSAFKKLLNISPEVYSRIQFHFIGTSYATAGHGKATILPFAQKYGVEDNVTELTDRISYYHSLTTLRQADALFIPGSDDANYTPSKIYPYLLTPKPVLAVFNPASPAVSVLKEYGVKHAYTFDDKEDAIFSFFAELANHKLTIPNYNPAAIQKHDASQMTLEQCALFDEVIDGQNTYK